MSPAAQIIIFAGTSEGRKLGEVLAVRGVQVLLCVATSYGQELVTPGPGLTVLARRMDAAEMAALLRENSCKLVVDATHPYAVEVTGNIRAACAAADAEYIRLVREQGDTGDVRTAATAAEAAAILNETGERALLTVGSKELEAFTAVDDYQSRLFARVLPMAEVVEKCVALGFAGKNLLCMQGPFSHELNAALIRALEVDCLVTKDSGAAGGFSEKLSAVRETGIRMLLIARPVQEEGLSLPQVLELLANRFAWAEPQPAYPRFPLFVDIAGEKAVVVGGGNIAERRVRTLLQFGARVEVVSPALTRDLQLLAAEGKITWTKRDYFPGALAGAALAVAATDVRAVNRGVGEEAKTEGIPLSVADDRDACTFWFPAVVRTGDIVAGLVSATGDHHGAVRQAAAILRERLENK